MNRRAVCLIMSIAAGYASADDGARALLVERGLDAYAEAQALTDRDARIASFARAEQLFSQIARSGDANADLYANTGTSALQAERLGPAVLAFRRALALDPDHERSRRNLAHARTLLPAWVPRFGGESVLDTFFFWHRALSPAERAGAGVLCFLLAAVAFAVSIRWPGRLARGLSFIFAAAWVGFVASIIVEGRSDPRNHAVITAEETFARASDSANAAGRFPDPLPGGTEVQVIETRERWTRIRLANDREAWVSSGSLEPVLEID